MRPFRPACHAQGEGVPREELPHLGRAARRGAADEARELKRRLDERPFLYGSVFMSNSASLLLPGSNLTNLLALRDDPISSASFAPQMFPAWFVACGLTSIFLAAAYCLDGEPYVGGTSQIRLGVGPMATLATAALVLALRNPALPVLAVGLAATALRRIRLRLDPKVLVPLFAPAVRLGAAARIWNGPSQLLASSGRWATAGIAACSSLLINNLPAAVLFSAHTAAPTRAARRARPGPQPRRDRFPLRRSMAAGRSHRERRRIDCHLHQARCATGAAGVRALVRFSLTAGASLIDLER